MQLIISVILTYRSMRLICSWDSLWPNHLKTPEACGHEHTAHTYIWRNYQWVSTVSEEDTKTDRKTWAIRRVRPLSPTCSGTTVGNEPSQSAELSPPRRPAVSAWAEPVGRPRPAPWPATLPGAETDSSWPGAASCLDPRLCSGRWRRRCWVDENPHVNLGSDYAPVTAY